MTEGSVTGHGQLSVVPGVGDPGVSGVGSTGVTVRELADQGIHTRSLLQRPEA